MSDAHPLFGEFVSYREVRGVSRPMLLAEIRLADECHDCQMLVDSGADNIVLPRYMLELFGLEEADCTVHRGFTLSGYVQALTGPVFQLAFPELWPDSSLSSQIVFAEWLDERGYGLLGREPTYDHMSVPLWP